VDADCHMRAVFSRCLARASEHSPRLAALMMIDMNGHSSRWMT
jgi:hypothetical protein